MKVGLFRLLSERFESRVHETMAMLADTPESVSGKPWDKAHYIRVFRVEKSGVFLEIDTSLYLISGLVQGLTGVHTCAHPWGTALILEGPLRWVGTRTVKANGVKKLFSRILPSLQASRTVDYNEDWNQITLVLPYKWNP